MSGKTLLLLLLFLIVSCLHAQDIRNSFYYSNRINEGLSQLSVRAILQDSKGYIWIGTRNGLNRYNGSEYTVYQELPGDSLSLSDNDIFSLAEEPGRALWIATGHGVSRRCHHTARFSRYEESKGIPNDIVQTIYVDRSGRVWAGSRRGLYLYHSEQDCFIPVKFDAGEDQISVSAIFEDSSGRFWLGTSKHGVYLCDSQMQILCRYSADSNLALSDNNISSIHEDHLHRIWVGCSTKGLNCLDLRNNRITQYTSSNSGLTNNFVRCLVEWDGQLLIGTYDGIFAFNLATDVFDKVADYNNDSHSLGHFSVYAFCLSRDRMLWIGTYSGGISLLSRQMNRFRRHSPGQHANIQTGIYSGACVGGNGDLWIATEGHGLLNYDPVTQRSQFYLLDRKSYSLHNANVIKTLLPDRDCLWCGTASGEIYRFDFRTRTFSLFYRYAEPIAIYSMIFDSHGNLWASTIRETQALTCFTPDRQIIDSFRDANGGEVRIDGIHCLFEEQPGMLLIGTRRNGLYRYDIERGLLTNYCKEASADSGHFIPGNYISTIIRTKSGEVWVSTYGSGIFRFEADRGATTCITNHNGGLSDNNICKLIAGRDGNLWMSTASGISVYNSRTGAVRNYKRDNGVDVREFTLHGGTTLSDGTLCFTANDGFITFQPLDLQQNGYVPPVVLELLSVNNRTIIPGDESRILPVVLDEMEQIILDYDENNLSISYRALNYLFSNMNSYAYRLDGYDQEWNEAGNRTVAYYTNLRPGTYTFQVRGSNNDGVWNMEGHSLRIIVDPPFWATWYAYLFYFLVVFGVAYVIFYYMNVRRHLRENLQAEQLKKKQQEKMHQAQLRLFTNFSHELRTPLMLIITPFEELIRRIGLPAELHERLNIIYKNSRKLLLLVNQMMDLQKNQTGNMQLRVSKDNVCEFIKEIYYAFNQIAQTNEIEFQLICHPKEIEAWYDKSLLEKLIFNLLSNAFKYTPPGKKIRMVVKGSLYAELDEHCRVSLRDPEDLEDIRYLVLRIEDSGPGIPKEERDKIFIPFYQVPESGTVNIPGTGIGLSLVNSLVNLCRGSIFLEDMEHPGACFVVVLPISRRAFSDDEVTLIDDENTVESCIGVQLETETSAVSQSLPIPSGDTLSENLKDQRYKILLVEDDKDVRDYLRSSLENEYDIIEASNGMKGYDCAVADFPDLVLSDIMMPKRNGLELCSMIKNDIRIGHIPVILMTARSMVVHIKEGFSSGADDYIIKPFNMEVLRTRIRSLLINRAQLKKLYGKRFSPDVVGLEAFSADERFSQKLFAVIEEHITDQALGVELLCQEIGISRANLYRKFKSITELSPTELIRNKRLEVAARLLKESEMSVSEIAAMLGFNSHSYFSNSFKNLYGYTPTEFIQRRHSEEM